MSWHVEILDAAVASEIDALPADVRASLARIVDRIEAVDWSGSPRRIIDLALMRAKAIR